ncbi:CpsB/CapC family capsule biosynthesis tyrosine phosphatase [Paenibacillus sp. GP183]|uniref:tyrosine-protein phosphatase n=1 Tax=Paenibacillus sp. GP183 TaxID=1882751 RepID=UPI0008986136|nr:CpsB/CapC family capsule biosynthesis tyrosine phosphatase [Paenibacillus sp. GP183]SEC11529.1 protein-tyrosine phosphatase [Paenibacillus sp. GP183]
MIDIHSHILPDLDDGSTSLSESLEMAREAVKQGIHKIIATPHHANGTYLNETSRVEQSVHTLNEELQLQGIPLTVYIGQEIRLYRDLLEDLDHSRIVTLNRSKYMLVEFPSSHIPNYTDELFHELGIQKITPIIAHPERNQEIKENPSRLLELIEKGGLSQVTAHSILGGFGKTIQAFSMNLCKNHLAHFLASDAHNLTNRPCVLGQAYQTLRENLGNDVADLFQQNARCVLEDHSLLKEIPVWSRRKWFKFWG